MAKKLLNKVKKTKAKPIGRSDLLHFYLDTGPYCHDFVVCIYAYPNDRDGENWIMNHLEEEEDIEYVADFLLVPFEDEGEAIDFCNNIPDSQPYATVWSRKAGIIHENT